VDDFHHVQTIRYQRGRLSPEGFWLDSYNYRQFRIDVLDPLGPGGSRWYRPAAHDLATDQVVTVDQQLAPAGAVVIVDGLFLHRDELAGAWDFSVFLDVTFDVTVRRMAKRDGSQPDPHHPSLHRYVQGQRLYLAECDPQRRASLTIDNSRTEAPTLIER
jgi:uridine kinase